jgi:hypothetical protein
MLAIEHDSAAVLAKASRTRLHLGHTVAYQSDTDVTENLYLQIPSRMHLAMQFISLLDTVNERILDELLPVIYELISASNDHIRAMGAAALFHLLQCEMNGTNLWESVADNLLSLLDNMRKTTRDGTALAIVGLAQRQLFRRLPKAKYQQARCQATQQWLRCLLPNTHQEELLWGILVGAVVPLLYDHAVDAIHSNTEVMELGRLGVTALLPLLQTDDSVACGIHSPTMAVPLAAATALLNLLVAAYPVMPRHGGKIMSALLACMGEHVLTDEVDERSSSFVSLFKTVQHVAAVTVVICGERAVAVLERVCLEKGLPYNSSLVSIAAQVQDQADSITSVQSDHVVPTVADK